MSDGQRHGGDLDYTADTLKRSSAATVQRNLQTIPRMEDGSPRYARGWHIVGWSDEFADHEVVPRDYFGMRLARSEEHTSAPQSLMRTPHSFFCCNNNNPTRNTSTTPTPSPQ